MYSFLLFITKEQSLGEAGQSEKWGQGHSEVQVRRLTDLLHWRQTLRPVLGNMVLYVVMMLCFYSGGLKVSIGMDFVNAQ